MSQLTRLAVLGNYFRHFFSSAYITKKFTHVLVCTKLIVIDIKSCNRTMRPFVREINGKLHQLTPLAVLVLTISIVLSLLIRMFWIVTPKRL